MIQSAVSAALYSFPTRAKEKGARLIAAFIIVFREVIEAGLIIGIVLAATQGTLRRLPYIFGGFAGGLLCSGILAIFAGSISNALEGVGQEVFNAAILGIAAMMLAWHNVWMARRWRLLAAMSVKAPKL